MSEVTVFERDALSDLVREVLEESDESANAYLVQSWLSSAIEALYDARRRANLTQKEVAERLGTKQPAIARLEKDDEGRVSLHRYIEYALACGVLPLDLSLRPVSALREYALNDPDAPRTERAYEAWRNGVAHGLGNAPSTAADNKATLLPLVANLSSFSATSEKAEKKPQSSSEAAPLTRNAA